jgi:hypothetical protein
MSDFVANPAQSQQYPTGWRTDDLVYPRSSSIEPRKGAGILTLCDGRLRIGRRRSGPGLGQAAQTRSGALADEIQQAVTATLDEDDMVAYRAVTGDQAIGATGGGSRLRGAGREQINPLAMSGFDSSTPVWQ